MFREATLESTMRGTVLLAQVVSCAATRIDLGAGTVVKFGPPFNAVEVEDATYDGNTVAFSIDASADQLSSFAFAVSEKDLTDPQLIAAYTAYPEGDWTISGKTYENTHIENKGSPHKMSGQEEHAMVEFCGVHWDAKEDRKTATATFADADCNCGECQTRCGLRGSRLDVPGNDDPFPATFPPNCTQYAGSPTLVAGQDEDYCCDLYPSGFANAVDPVSPPQVMFATGAAYTRDIPALCLEKAFVDGCKGAFPNIETTIGCVEAAENSEVENAENSEADLKPGFLVEADKTSCALLAENKTACELQGLATPPPSGTSVACSYVSGGPTTDADGVEAIIGITPPSNIKYSECKATDQASKYFLYIVNSGKVANIGVETDIRPLNAAEIVACTPPAPAANVATQHSLLTTVNLAAAIVLVHGLQ
jgi:hypothetical protein